MCSSGESPKYIYPHIYRLTHTYSYPETANLTLEEIDFLFTKEGNKGAKKFLARSQPVLESLKPVEQIEQDAEKAGGESDEADHVEEKKSLSHD